MSWDIPPKIWLPPKPAIIRPAPVSQANFLPGMFPGFAGAGAALSADAAALSMGAATAVAQHDLGLLAFVTSSTADNSSLTAMADIRAGDLLVWYDYTDGGAGNVPSGFTQIGSTLAGSALVVVTAYKIADGTESSAAIAGMDGSGARLKILLQFRAEVVISSIAVQDVAQEIISGDPSSQTCNASGGAVSLVVIGTYSANNPVGTRTFSTTADGEISINFKGTVSSHVKYKIYNSSPSNTSIDTGDNGSDNALQSFFLEAA